MVSEGKPIMAVDAWQPTAAAEAESSFLFTHIKQKSKLQVG